MNEALTLIYQGGWPMAILGLCSIAGAAIIIERAFALRRNRVIDPELARALDRYDAGAAPEQVLLLCRRTRGPFARIIEEIIHARHLHHAQLIETMHATGRTQTGRLERGLTVLEIIAGASPLIGLLGTVLGMVAVFNAITAAGTGNPQVLSEGISQALITTVAGLCIAIPALAAHSWFSRRVDDYAAEMHDRATSFIAKLHPGDSAERLTHGPDFLSTGQG